MTQQMTENEKITRYYRMPEQDRLAWVKKIHRLVGVILAEKKDNPAEADSDGLTRLFANDVSIAMQEAFDAGLATGKRLKIDSSELVEKITSILEENKKGG